MSLDLHKFASTLQGVPPRPQDVNAFRWICVSIDGASRPDKTITTKLHHYTDTIVSGRADLRQRASAGDGNSSAITLLTGGRPKLLGKTTDASDLA
jgi:hypothetical protein